jgi:hypothetical protein
MHVNTTDTECKLKLWTSFVVGIILYISSNYRRYTKCKYLRTKQYLQEEVKCERTRREDENARMRENAARMREDDGARGRRCERTLRECENASRPVRRSVDCQL